MTDPEWARPDLDVVTGVSTGAQIAPFAFIGTDERYQEVEDFYRNPKKDWIRERGLLFFLPSNPSFATIPGLSRDVRNAVDREFIEQIAARSSEGKLLVISATDLDFGRQRVRDVGLEVEYAMMNDDPGRVIPAPRRRAGGPRASGRWYNRRSVAGVVQRVEPQLPKLDVAGSIPVARFRTSPLPGPRPVRAARWFGSAPAAS
mgnify:CR=1 FL=1